MTVEPHKLQQDPPEGSPEVIDRELQRQSEKPGDKPSSLESENSKAMDEAAPQTGVRPGP